MNSGPLAVRDSCHFWPCLRGSAAGTGGAEGPGRIPHPTLEVHVCEVDVLWVGEDATDSLPKERDARTGQRALTTPHA